MPCDRTLPRRRVLRVIALLVLLSGCSQTLPDREIPVAETRIRALARLSRNYAAKHNKKPASLEELKAWTKKLNKTELGQAGIDDADAAFVSPRDNQPYVLVKGGGSGPGDVLAYEQTGVAGKHYIVTPMGRAFELDDLELKRRVPSAK